MARACRTTARVEKVPTILSADDQSGGSRAASAFSASRNETAGSRASAGNDQQFGKPPCPHRVEERSTTMKEDEDQEIVAWENPDCPAKFDVEVYPPIGILRIAPHYIKWWRRPFCVYRGWFWWRWWYPTACCCCCCGHGAARPAVDREPDCTIDVRLAPNTFGPGRAIRILRTHVGFHVEFIIEWNASGTGQVTVDVDLIQAPGGVPVPRRVAAGRGPNDSVAFGGTSPGTYVFRATARTASGHSCFDTVTVNVPGF
jgi:hypothetical protein